MIFYILLGLLILSLTLNGFLKKTLTNFVSVDEYLFIMCHIIIISTYLYFLCKYILGKNKIKKDLIKKLDKKTILTFIFCGINAIFASALFVYLLKSEDVSYIIPHTSSLLIICTILVGCCYYGEVINKKKIIGIIFVLIGLTIINLKDKQSIAQSNV
jgi:drug/metabolite transporter (DMT)-like permease